MYREPFAIGRSAEQGEQRLGQALERENEIIAAVHHLRRSRDVRREIHRIR
jgi:hypothetical protein